MKRLGITQRVEEYQHYQERRDCLDQRWASFSVSLNCMPCPLPNLSIDKIPEILEGLKLDGIIFTGGNSLAYLNSGLGDAAPERDAFESALLMEAMVRGIPVVGICRGMQLINVELGGKLTSVSGHVGLYHSIIPSERVSLPKVVNSYHNWAIPSDGLSERLRPLAFDSGGNIEAFEGLDNRLLGIMWHPEREDPFSSLDIELMKGFLL